MNRSRSKALVVLIAITLIASYFFFGLDHYLSLDYLKAQRGSFQTFYAENAVATVIVFTVIYILSTALSLPGATILTLTAGALFGLVTGTIIVSFASTIGASIAFLTARFLLKDSVQRRFEDRLHAINEGVSREGAFYLFTLRLIPAFPFFVINLVMGLTPIKASTFFWVSQLGMLPGTLVYVNAGTQLAQIESMSMVLSPQLLMSFVLLGLFPLLARKTLQAIGRRSGAKLRT